MHSYPNGEVIELEKFVLFNLLTGTPFNLPHLFFLHLGQTLANYKEIKEGRYYFHLVFRNISK
ncbi:hypothetical protein LR48_Vigan11g136400 [Vigna angularis]|uniref:Uncharacterized protein n=1 Tax=Phaseolus angularis TaxID=3914 RepID=A0A0L9VTC5_PHAAN|nr:hypothetical protein LR48_Vigan11g136400 [Vigna angularis]